MPAPRSGCLDLGKNVVTSLRMSRSWKECRHLARDVSILERVSVTGPGCIREGGMSCVVMGTYGSMSTYVSCAGMSRKTYGSCENCVYKEGCLPCFVFLFSSCNLLYSIRNINLVCVSSVPPFPPNLRMGDARLTPPAHVRHVRLTLSVLVRHVSPTLSVSLSDTSIRRSPSPCPKCPSDVVRSCPTRPSDAVRLCLPFAFPFLFPFPFPFPSRFRSCSRSTPVPGSVSPPPRFRSRSRVRHQNSLKYLEEPPPLHWAELRVSKKPQADSPPDEDQPTKYIWFSSRCFPRDSGSSYGADNNDGSQPANVHANGLVDASATIRTSPYAGLPCAYVP